MRYAPQTNANLAYPQQVPTDSQAASQQQQQSAAAATSLQQSATSNQTQRHSDPLSALNKDKMLNFGDLAKTTTTTPPFKDFFNNLHAYQYLQQLEQASADSMLPRHTQITQQYSSSTDEGCDTDDHGGKRK
jgi:hypothetical protein